MFEPLNKSQQLPGALGCLGSASQVKGCNLSEAIPGGLQQAISAAKTSDAWWIGGVFCSGGGYHLETR